MLKNKHNLFKISSFIVGALIFIYLLLRAKFVPFVHDECASFFHYVFSNSFLPWKASWDANNHVVNSMLMTLFYKISGTDILGLRLPNVLSFLLYFYSVFQISKKIENNFLRITFFVSLMLSHGFIEFFALARGYGMSMAFLSATLLFAIKLFENYKHKYLLFYFLFQFFAVWANLTLIPVLIIADFLILIILFRKSEKTKSKFYFIFSLLSLISKIPAVIFGFELNSKGALYYGDTIGFWHLSVQRLQVLLWGNYNKLTDLIIISLVLLFAIAFGILVKTKKINYKQFFFSSLFILIIIGIFAQNIILKINFPEDRTGMYLFPLFMFALFFVLDNEKFKFSKYLTSIVFIMPLHFVINLNLTHTLLWKQEHIPVRFYEKIAELKNENEIFVGGSHKTHGFQWAFYDIQHNKHLGPLQHGKYYNSNFDYLILRKEETDSINSDEYKLILDDKASGNMLLTKKNQTQKRLIFDSIGLIDINNFNQEFIDLYRFKCADYKNKDLMISVEGDINFHTKDNRTVLVWAGSTLEVSNYYYELYFFDWYRNFNNKFQVAYYFINIPEDMEELLVYLYNPKLSTYDIRYLRIKIFEVKSKDNPHF